MEPSKPRRDRIDWSRAEFVETVDVVNRCPGCGLDDYQVIRSMGDQGDDVRHVRCVCRLCSTPFIQTPRRVSASEWQTIADTFLD